MTGLDLRAFDIAQQIILASLIEEIAWLKERQGKMDTYKNILNTVVQPLCDHDEDLLRMWVTRLKQSDEEAWAVGEMLERALRYIRLTVALANEASPLAPAPDAPQEVLDADED